MLTSESHIPVLLNPLRDRFVAAGVRTIFDGTLGLGGHAEAFMAQIPTLEQYIATDLDQEHLDFARERLAGAKVDLHLHHDTFAHLSKYLPTSVPRPLGILLDLGLCSHHVDEPARGFSYSADGPLDMRFDTASGDNVMTYLKGVNQEELATALREYGEEPRAWKIAERVVAAGEVKTTAQLREIITAGVPPRDHKKTCMRVFQALRMVVNDELGALEQAIIGATQVMRTGDLLAIIAYHSLEDRVVKRHFRRLGKPETEPTALDQHAVVTPAWGQEITKKPILASGEEVADNPRARSAKLRILEAW